MEDIISIEKTSGLTIDIDMDIEGIPDGGTVLGRYTDGDVRYSESVFPIYDAGGRKVGGILVIADINDYILNFIKVFS